MKHMNSTQLMADLPLLKPRFQMSYSDKIFSIGSCFADAIAQKLSKDKFQIISNPFGTMYNPISIYQSLYRIRHRILIRLDEIREVNEQYCHFDFHGRFNQQHSQTVFDTINQSINESHNQLKHCTLLIITLGSSQIYTLKESNSVVANCHQISSDKFHERFLTVEETADYLNRIVQITQELGIQKIIWTISPLRYFTANPQSNAYNKGILHLALSKLLEGNNASYYFPSYEIVLDQLRDYRFYDVDLRHPNDLAISIIYEQLLKIILQKNELAVLGEIRQIMKNTDHEIKIKQSTATRKFAQSNLQRMKQLMERHSEIDFSEEIKSFEALIS